MGNYSIPPAPLTHPELPMNADGKVNILLVDDQPAKLLSYEAILEELGENLIKASSGTEALQQLLKTDIAVILMDVSMPELDGFQLAAMIREHPRYQNTAIIFVSAINLADVDHLRGYEMGAVDYVPIPVIPQVLRAKVKIFAELYRKTRQLERLNAELERRVSERTAELEALAHRLLESERRRNLALAAGRMGSWDWDLLRGDCIFDEGQCRIFGVDPKAFVATPASVRKLIHPEDWERLASLAGNLSATAPIEEVEFRVCRPNGQIRWCIGTAAASADNTGKIVRVSGVTYDITERKRAEERQALLAREVDHRAKNALAVAQSVVRLTRAQDIHEYIEAVEQRINALSRAHTLLAVSRWKGISLTQLVYEELAPYMTDADRRVVAIGSELTLSPAVGQSFAMALHELATNAAKHGALSSRSGKVTLSWHVEDGWLQMVWAESGGPVVRPPASRGFGTKMISASIERQLGGRVSFDWRADGLVCALAAPIRDASAPATAAENAFAIEGEEGAERPAPALSF